MSLRLKKLDFTHHKFGGSAHQNHELKFRNTYVTIVRQPEIDDDISVGAKLVKQQKVNA